MAITLQDIPQQERWNKIREILQENFNLLNLAIGTGGGGDIDLTGIATEQYVDNKDSKLRDDLKYAVLKPAAALMANKDGKGRVIADTYMTKADASKTKGVGTANSIRYKKVTITDNNTDGYGIFIYARQQIYLMTSNCESGTAFMGHLWELGTNYNGKAISSNTRYIHVKAVKSFDNDSPTTLYIALDARAYFQIQTSGEITIYDSSADEWKSITSGTSGWVPCTYANFNNTTYDVATTSANGLMSRTDKTNLNNALNHLDSLDENIADIIDGTTTVGKATNATNADHANSADNATNATNAEIAEQATQDSNGNVISDTYALRGTAVATTDLDKYVPVNKHNGGVLAFPLATQSAGGAMSSADKKKLDDVNEEIANIKNGTTTVGRATNATTATNLANKPSIAKGTTSTNAITVTAGGKTSDEFTVPYATNAGGASSSQTARELETAPSLSADGDAIKVTAGGKPSTAFTVPFATKATTLTDKPTVTQVDQNKKVTITVGGQTSESFTIGYATTAGSATTANSATKATQDGNGKVIAETYATKANLGTLTEGYDALMEALTWQ
jgi:hypothetical protein